ncbi:MAG: adk [Thermoleophilia bacterium]|nr:adk [Thermoleophilia bacterium]
MSTAPIVLIMGPPGAGKGTQAGHLVDTYGLRHVATGDLLRTAVSNGTPLGLEAKRFMDAGDLVPDDVIIGMIRELIAASDASVGVLLDGFPRTDAQALALDQTLADLGRQVDVVLDISVPDDTLVERLSGRWICRTCQTPYNVNSRPPAIAGVCDLDGGELYQRTDDQAEAVRHRLDVYHTQTAPVADYYRDNGRLVEIDGDQAPTDVRAALDSAIQPVST